MRSCWSAAPPAPSDNAVRVIRRSAEHLADLIDGMLDISKIENGMLRLNRDKVPLAEFLDQIVDMFRLQAAAKGIEFLYQRPPQPAGFVHTDQKRLRQILINLLSNAIKYTERGSASLMVRYRSQVAEFEMSDTGVGIPAHELERVFEPFERGQGANVRAIPGTGLGLTITKLLTQIMGGEINAVEHARAGHHVHGAPAAVGGRRPTPLTASRSARTITRLRRPAPPAAADRRRRLAYRHRARLLRPLGFELHAAPDGPRGSSWRPQCRPDLAMVDMSMPGMTGWQVAAGLRATPGLRGAARW